MAKRFYGLNRGESSVTESGSTTGKDLEVAVDLTKGYRSAEILTDLQKIFHHILKNASGQIP